ncbi:penicillin acylase family protein [Sporosarcina thermotolerans]|uniref:Penicillin acylase family protein n=1 Tax=Sporosarcina thermotolerans TaxID=633404 RepID=A0AAW9AAE8_9BACL|nr:penicillin acylase family protein [Sporosarcina thermotolerans]MDW0118019.1 penicillin acylase family protein [Sporosarcina thermotolerans]
MGKWTKLLLSVFGGITAILVIGLIAINLYIGKSKPFIDGERNVSFLDNDVEIVRDVNGVPHIEAGSDADLYRAQGYVQAQDRLFQMDLARRQASGRLSEVVGAAAVDTDKNFRTFSLRNAAEASYDGYGDEAKKVLAWFAEGVNAFIEQAREEGKLPYEFKIFGYEPELWTPIDSLTIGKYMAYDLGGNWHSLAVRHWALNNFPEEQARELFVSYPDNAPSIIEANLKTPVEVAGRFNSDLVPHEFNGSNNWVVSGDKTASGRPLLSNDPHLGLNTPSIWYQMHLQSPEQNVGGVIFAGVPGIILGHNEDIAWGVTNVGPDVQDLYIEIPNPENPTQFRYDGKWEQAEVRDETIKVKGDNDVPFKVIVTRHGPIMSNILYKSEDPGALFSMQWTALEPTKELEAIIRMNKASNWETFEAALEDFHAPAQNFVFAAKDGTIAYKANGRIPIRKKGDAQLPVPGDSSEYGWAGYVPYDELPRVVNPKVGFIATANNEVVDDSYPYHITKYWAQPYRYMRIAEVLGKGDNFTAEDMMELQMDQANLYAREFLQDLIGSVEATDKEGRYTDVISMLREWNQIDSPEAGAPLVFHKLMRQLPKTMLSSEMPGDVYRLMPGKGQIVDQMLRDAYSGKLGVWVSNYGGVDKWVYDAFETSIAEIEERFGNDSAKWKWGDFHQLAFPHSLSAASPIFAYFLNPEKQAIGGSNVTVQAAAFNDNGTVYHGASWRFVADLSDLSTTYHIVGPGQSGHMKSKWFHDQAEDWANGIYHETVLDGKVEKGYTLKLKAK